MAEFVTTTGVIVADTADILSGVQQEWKDAFSNQDLVVTADTPQGVMITAETAARVAVVENNVALANQINPGQAGGIFLDALCALTGLKRTAASRSTVTATLSGVAGTPIPEGSIAATAAGDRFTTIGAVTIGAGGTVDAAFQSAETGAIPCAVGALSVIVSAVLGWEAVTNAAAATLGKARQSDPALRGQRRVTLAKQGTSLTEAITSALYAVDGVKSLSFRENTANAETVIDGITLAGKSVWVCVDGGTDSAVAAALLDSKSGGCAWNGATEVSVIEAASGQTYAVKFDRPASVPIKARVTVKVTTASGDVQTSVRAAVMAWTGQAEDGIPGLRVGDTVSPFDIAAYVNSAINGIYVTKVELTTVAADSFAVADITVALDQLPALATGSIAVVTA